MGTEEGERRDWHRSSHSNASPLEVARDGEFVLVRNRKDPVGDVLRFSQSEWEAFCLGVEHGDFDLI